MVPLSVLDLAPVSPGASPREAIRDAVALAQRCDALGYARYWFAEHHSMPTIATSAPEVLVAHVAAVTTRIRVGTGGIMLPNHNPLRLVEIFRTLEALHPGRIDFGVGRAPGTDPVTASALQGGTQKNPNVHLMELLAFENSDFPDDHPFKSIVPMPSDVRLPPVWMLGSTMAGAGIAASLGLQYAFAGHFAMRDAHEALSMYRSQFQRGNSGQEARAILAVTVICGEDIEHAQNLILPLKLAIVRNRMGQRSQVSSMDEALGYRFSPEEERLAAQFFEGAIIGGPDQVRVGLKRLVNDYEPDELMVAAFLPDRGERLRAFERIAMIAGLGPES